MRHPHQLGSQVTSMMVVMALRISRDVPENWRSKARYAVTLVNMGVRKWPRARLRRFEMARYDQGRVTETLRRRVLFNDLACVGLAFNID